MSEPSISAQLISVGTNDFAMFSSDSFTLMLDQAISGGAGTSRYLQHLRAFANLMQYLQQAGPDAYQLVPTSEGNGLAVTATDGRSVLMFQTVLSPELQPVQVNGVEVVGLATLTLQTPGPSTLTKIAELGWEIFDRAHQVHTAVELWESLLHPLGRQAATLVGNLVDDWLSVSVNAGSIDTGIELTTLRVVSEVSEETVPVVEEGVEVAEMAIEWAAVAETAGLFALVAAVPLVVETLEKNFVLNFQINNICQATDFTWELVYVDEGAPSSRPASNTLPAVSRITNPLTNATSTVVHQADFTFVNTDGLAGTGFVVALTPVGANRPLLAAIIDVPWAGDNSIHLVSPYGRNGALLPWNELYETYSPQDSGVAAQWGNAHFFCEMGIDSLEGNNDVYNCVLRIRDI